ncbi:MAG TPA: crosslink repair DNA glycosylase YcaQ family protein [Stackebrandtia sp.]|uniref:DNA glycosylase AlkZ-like family protein n=1 Tax=Stackebrandtia sp. TaxID=2023065 RepID=UPI002D3A5452|nr:crosslink repair DNA glycosylase YcaQ family protein [Stackebrandtia sp.]HZE38301.1 crosslink repair DNA glycosylase YcaQ family protein [Stackebrandtia sp.]
MAVHELTRADARRIAVRAQLLTRQRPKNLLEAVRGLSLLQLDPTAAIAPNADLVAYSRLGHAYSTDQLPAAIARRELFEIGALYRHGDDLPLYRAPMAVWPGDGKLGPWQERLRDWVAANDACRRDILKRLEASGPLPSRELPDTCAVSWESTGWTNNRNVTKLLDFMLARGEVAISGRQGKVRLWDLAERIYPDADIPTPAEALRLRNERRLSSLGIARAKDVEVPVEPADVGEAGEEAVVEGVAGTWRVDPAQLGQPFQGRAALLSPFDRLVHNRKRAELLFGFEYQLEMYKPAAKRRWGYFALPILYGDKLIGKLDAKVDKKAGVLRVFAIHEDMAFTKTMRAAIDGEIRELAKWLQVALEVPS